MMYIFKREPNKLIIPYLCDVVFDYKKLSSYNLLILLDKILISRETHLMDIDPKHINLITVAAA